MKYIVILVVYSLNLVFWRFALDHLSRKIIGYNKVKSIIISYLCSSLVPYAISLFIVLAFGLGEFSFIGSEMVFYFAFTVFLPVYLFQNMFRILPEVE